MANESFEKFRVNLSIKSKNGLDFTLSAGIVWILIAFVWTLNWKSYDKSVITFMVGVLLILIVVLF